MDQTISQTAIESPLQMETYYARDDSTTTVKIYMEFSYILQLDTNVGY